jgi:hypothetical protein
VFEKITFFPPDPLPLVIALEIGSFFLFSFLERSEGGGVVVGTIRDLEEHSALASGAVPGALKGYKGSYTYIHIPVELYGGRMGTHHLCSSQCP